ncbi:MAG: hypothetical protein CSA62_10305 [Planctomycetota bacterium]|nr:MAG: hypothetical protein CSA62_10305 [Planctomycetota bacterium]
MSWPFVGLEDLRRRLEADLGQRRLHHALLLTGAVGVGKRSLARFLARALLCERKRELPLGCGECGPCLRVERGQHSDVQILRRPQGKTQIPVEQVRELLALFARAELEGQGRVAILEDVDELGREGQNALLKTLEEPEQRRWLLLTTSRPELLLDTVRSRVQRLAVPALASAELAELLRSELGLEAGAAQRLAEVSQGSLGRAKSLHAEGLEDWERRYAALKSGQGGVEPWLRELFESLASGDEGLRQARRLRAERALALALVFAREEAHQGDPEAWSRVAAFLDAGRQLARGLGAELVLRGLWDQLRGTS